MAQEISHIWTKASLKSSKSIDIELPAVLVVGPQTLESSGIHPEHEIIREDRIIVLQDGGNFALLFSFEIQLHRLKVLDLSLREKLVKLLETEET